MVPSRRPCAPAQPRGCFHRGNLFHFRAELAPGEDGVAERSTPAWQSQLLAEATSRPGTRAPCQRAKAPTINRGDSPHGSRIKPAGSSWSPATCTDTMAAAAAPSLHPHGATAAPREVHQPAHPRPGLDSQRPRHNSWSRDQCRRCMAFYSFIRTFNSRFPFSRAACTETARNSSVPISVRDGGLQIHRHELSRIAVPGGQGGFNGRNFLQFFVPRHVVKHDAHPVLTAQ